MKSKRLLILLLMALLVPWVAMAQTPRTLTVCNGTTTSSNAPIRGGYGTQSEFIYPARLLEAMDGGTISSVKFYAAKETDSYSSSTVTVYVQEVNDTIESTSAWQYNQSSATKVYEGSTLTVTDSVLIITFSSPYEYNGGHLCFNVWKSESGSYLTVNYYGINPGYYSCGYDYSITPPVSNPYSRAQFLPKVEFTYTASTSNCEKPATFVHSNVTSSSATLTWSGGSGIYNVDYKKASDTEWTSVLTSSALTTTTLSLDENTAYEARVQSVCTSGNSGYKTVNFKTPCDDQDIPYTYGFETADSLDCWTVISGNVTRMSGYANNGSSYRLDFRGTTSNMIALPAFEEATNTLRVEFWTRPESNSAPTTYNNYSGKFAVGYMTDINDANTFVAVDTYIAKDMTTSYVKKTVDLTNAPVGAKIAMRQFDCATNYYWYVDDVTVKLIPSCLEPTGLAELENSATANSVQLQWTAVSGVQHWKLQYKKVATTEWTTVDVADTDLDGNGVYTLPGLESSSSYNVRIAAWCGYPGTNPEDMSEYCAPIEVNTACEVYSTFPFNEKFDSYTAGNNVLPTCWKYINTTTYSSYQVYPKIYNYSSNSPSNCLALVSYDYYYSSTDYDPQPQYAILREMTGLAGKQITLMAKGYTYNSTFKVGLMTNPADANTFVEIPTTQTLTTSYQEFVYDIPADATAHYVAIMIDAADDSNYGYGTSNGVYVDDISIDVPPTCIKPSALMLNTPNGSLTAHTVTLKWTNGSEGQEAWQIIYDTVMFNPDTLNLEQMSATLVNVTTNPATIGGLKNNKMYYAYVRANCGDGDYSKWNSQVRSFTTKSGKDKPTNLAVIDSTITNNQARVRWKGAATNDLHEYYQLYYSCLSTLPETLLEDSLISPISDTSYLFSNLDSEKKYYVWVRDYCGNDGYSAWTSSINFTTLADCPAPTITVSTPTAHGATVAWTGGFSDTYTVWYQEPSYVLGVSTDFTSDPTTNWVNGSGVLNETDGTATITSGSYWSFSTNCGVFDRHAYFNMYTAKNYWLVTPKTTIPQGYTFSFDVAYTKYSSSGANNPAVTGGPHRLLVLISTDNKAHWTILREWNNTGSDYVLDNIAQTGQTVSDISLDNYVGQEVYVAFLGISSTTDYDNNIHLDNIIVGKTVAATGWEVAAQGITQSPCVLNDATIFAPETDYEVKVTGICGEAQSEPSNVVGFTTTATCTAPEGLVVSDETTTGATFTWTAVEGVNFQYVYGAATQTPDFTNASSTTGNRVVVDDANLEPNTSYVFYLRKDCGDDDYSEYRLAAFKTACGEEPVPYTYDFETADKFDCWTPFISGIYIANGTTYNHTEGGSKGLFFSGSTDKRVALPLFSEPTNTLRIEFWTRPEGYNYSNCGKFDVGYMTDLEKAETFHAIATYNYNDWTANDFEKKSVDFNNPDDEVPADAYIVLRQYDCTSNYYWYVDDVTVKLAPSCEEPEVAEVTDITPTSATLNWTGEHESFNVQYRTAEYSYPAEGSFFDDFESGTLTGWTTIRGGEGNDYTDWKIFDGNFTDGLEPAHSGTYVAMSRSWATNDYNVDNWLISPQVTLNGSLIYWVRDDGSYHEHYDVYVSTTTNDAASFTLLYEPGNASDIWTKHVVDLSSYNGTLGYIAFRHTDEGQDWLFIDDVTIGPMVTVEAGEWSDPIAVTENNYPLDNLDSETEYEWQVQGICESSESIWVAGDNFTTLSACVAPVADSAINITYNSADLYWTGYQENYNVRYRTAEDADEYFFDNLLNGQGDWTVINAGEYTDFYDATDEYGVFEFASEDSEPQYLISPELPDGIVSGSTLMFYYAGYYVGMGYPESFKVSFSSTTADLESFTEWSDEVTVSSSTYMPYTIAVPAGTKYFAIQCTSETNYDLELTYFYVYGPVTPAGEWQYANNVTSPASIDELEDGTLYEWQVQGAGCADSDWSNSLYFQTEEQTTVTQTIELSAGWNWISSNVVITMDDLKAALVEALPGTAITIKSKNDGFTNYTGTKWKGTLSTIDLTQMYQVQVTSACEITLTGEPIDPTEYPINIAPGVNWIAFPFAESMTLANAFAGFAISGDNVKSKNDGFANYTNKWKGQLTNLVPGQGYIFTSPSSELRTFIYPVNRKTSAPETGKKGVLRTSFDLKNVVFSKDATKVSRTNLNKNKNNKQH